MAIRRRTHPPSSRDVDEPQHHVADAVDAGALDRPSSESLDGGGDPADLGVSRRAQRVAVAAFPHLRQCGGDERQGIVAGDVGGDQRDELRFHVAAGAPGRHLDDPPQLVVGRRADQHLGVVDQLGEPAGGGEHGELICAHDDDDVHVERGVEHEVDQPAGKGFCRARGECLLELIDDEKLRPRLVELADPVEGGHRVATRHDHMCAPGRRARQAATADERDQARPHERGLPAPRRADDGDEPAVEHPRRELGHQPLATDEEVGVLRAVAGERPVRLAPRPRRADQLVAPRPCGDQFEDVVEHGRAGDVRRGDGADRRRRGCLQPVAGCTLSPTRRLPPGDARHAGGDGGDDAGRVVRHPVVDGDAHDVLVPQRPNGRDDRAGEVAQGLDRGAAGGRIGDQQDEEGQLLGGAGDRLDRGDSGRRHPLGIVDDEQQRAAPAAIGDRVDDLARQRGSIGAGGHQ